jgi:DNA-binding transcriptional ArsR family regulator
MEGMIFSFSDERLRWLIGKGKSLIDQGDITLEDYERVMNDIIHTEMERKMIVNELRSNPLIVSEISSRVHLTPKVVLNHLIALRQQTIVEISAERNGELEFQII